MSRKEKLLKRFLIQPKDFTYDEAVRLLNDFEFYEVSTGKTSGSRVRFENEAFPDKFIRLHKPHPSNILKPYQLKEVQQRLAECNLLTVKTDNEDENK